MNTKLRFFINKFVVLCFVISFWASPSFAQYIRNYDNISLYEPQVLPLEEAKLGNHNLKLMIARTEFEKAKGLMFYTELASDTGMLFVYKEPQKLSFWMRNTIISLDLVYLSKDLVVYELISNMEPGYGKRVDSLPHYDSETYVQYALELKAGSIEKLGIKIGDKLEIPSALLYSDY